MPHDAALPSTTLGRLGGPSTGSPAEWAAAGAAIRKLHDAPLLPWLGRAGRSIDELTKELDDECELLVTNGVLPADLQRFTACGFDAAQVRLAVLGARGKSRGGLRCR